MTPALLGAVRTPNGWLSAATVRATAPVRPWLHVSGLVGGFIRDGEGPSLRDAWVGASILAVNQPDTQIRFTPGAFLPLGSVTAGLRYTLLANGSIDPTLGVSFARGSTWILMLDWQIRIPFYPGVDEIQQGVYNRGSGGIARRVGGGAVFAGLGAVGQQTLGLTSPGFFELAVLVDGTVPISERTALAGGLRVPIYTDDDPPPYRAALSVRVTTVIGKRPEHEPH